MLGGLTGPNDGPDEPRDDGPDGPRDDGPDEPRMTALTGLE